MGSRPGTGPIVKLSQAPVLALNHQIILGIDDTVRVVTYAQLGNNL